MSTTRYTKCPYCGNTGINVFYGAARTTIESPFQQCEKCKKYFTCNDKKEWAMMDSTRRWFFIFNGNCIWTGILLGAFPAFPLTRAINADSNLGYLFWIIFASLITFLMGLLR